MCCPPRLANVDRRKVDPIFIQPSPDRVTKLDDAGVDEKLDLPRNLPQVLILQPRSQVLSPGGEGGLPRSHERPGCVHKRMGGLPVLHVDALRDSSPLPEVSPVPNRRTSGRVTTLSDRARASIATEAMLADRPELATKNAAGEDDDADFISV